MYTAASTILWAGNVKKIKSSSVFMEIDVIDKDSFTFIHMQKSV